MSLDGPENTESQLPVLFQTGDFILASGVKSSWKVECDSLTDEDWKTLALMATEILPQFHYVVGVPRGGLRFARALREYEVQGGSTVLIADDVWTTGKSMKTYVEAFGMERYMGNWIGIVAFARRPIRHPKVKAIWKCSLKT